MSRWIVVSNRLPFSYDAKKKKISQSSGGLVTAINGIKTSNPIVWIGTLPQGIPPSLVNNFKSSRNIEYSYIKMSEDLYRSYYNDFCNDVLWPILHYETELVKFRTASWESYKEVNMLFAKKIAQVAKKDDVIWLHDFHLFLVPKYLKQLRPNIKIGFFLHIPFPSSEIYKQLPCREEIMTSLLHADAIGFHDFSYLRHFVSSVYSVLGISSSFMEIESPYNTTKLGVFPVSIDTQDFIKKANSPRTQLNIKRYGLDNPKMKYILGVDRLDYTKGITYKLESFKTLLENNPKHIGKLQLIQIAIPTRTEVPEYIELRHEVERLVSEINGRFSRINYVPVKYIFNSVDIHELMALYRSSDVLFVTSKRDGMNLVCLEYVSAQNKKSPGVVMLSEFAGAASTLSHAILINPYDIDDTVAKLEKSLSMPVDERKRRHSAMFDYLKDYTATVWAQSILEQLENKEMIIPGGKADLQKAKTLKEVKRKSNRSEKKVLFLDFDGTLSPIVDNPKDAMMNKKTKQLVKKLSQRKDFEIVIVTGRDRNFIKKQLSDVKCYLACEHGARFYDYKDKKWRTLALTNKSDWYKNAYRVMDEYSRRTPNSHCEKKNYAIAWHYRNSPEQFGEFQARKLVMDLDITLSHFPISVIQGKKVVEVKAIEANKGYFTEWFLSRYTEKEDFLFAIGDDRTDEDLFAALDKRGVTVKVGDPSDTKANYYVSSQENVQETIQQIFLS